LVGERVDFTSHPADLWLELRTTRKDGDMGIQERYAQAVNSDNLTVDGRTTWSDTDVLGAAGLAGKHHALGVALVRLFADGKTEAVIAELSSIAFRKARTMRVKLSVLQSLDLSKAVLGWHRFGICQPCGGTGYSVIAGTPIQGDECPHCLAGGRMPFDPMFPIETRELARWLSAEIDRAQAVAGSAAMAMLAPRLEL
jgi:hypothetical protein